MKIYLVSVKIENNLFLFPKIKFESISWHENRQQQEPDQNRVYSL